MLNQHHLLATHEEFVIRRYSNGIKLIRPSEKNPDTCNIKNIFSLPVHAFFLNRDSVIQNVNETTVKNCGFDSIQSAIGKTIEVAAKKETALFEFEHEKEVISSNQMKIKDEIYTSLNGNHFSALNIKYPWYNDKNDIIGVFGLAIINSSDAISFANKLDLVLKTGLLDQKHNIDYETCITPGIYIDNFYVTKRISDVLKLLMKGKTYKQIGVELHLSHRTIEFYLENVKVKLNVKTKSELIEKVIHHFNAQFS